MITNFNLIQLFFYLILGLISAIVYESHHKDSSKKEKQPGDLGVPKRIRRYIQIIQGVSIVTAIISDHVFLLEVFRGPIFVLIGMGISLLGLFLFGTAKYELGENFSSCANAYLPYKIVVTGPYKYIRHPIYTANLIITLGAFVSTGSCVILLFTTMMAILYLRSTVIEEAALIDSFTDYNTYKNQTGMFLPKTRFSIKLFRCHKTKQRKKGFYRIDDKPLISEFNRGYKRAGGFKPLDFPWAQESQIMGYFKKGILVGGYIIRQNPIRSIENLSEGQRKTLYKNLDIPLKDAAEIACWWADRTSTNRCDKFLMGLNMILNFVFNLRYKRLLICSFNNSYSNLYTNCGLIKVWESPSYRDPNEKYKIFIAKRSHTFTAISAFISRYFIKSTKLVKFSKWFYRFYPWSLWKVEHHK